MIKQLLVGLVVFFPILLFWSRDPATDVVQPGAPPPLEKVADTCYRTFSVAGRPLDFAVPPYNVSFPEAWLDGLGRGPFWIRLREVLFHASLGGNFTVVVLGGSVTCGLYCTVAAEDCYNGTVEVTENFLPKVVKEYLNCSWVARFELWFRRHHPQTNLRLINGCFRATTFQWAINGRINKYFPNGYLSDGTKIDLIISDYSANEVIKPYQSDKQRRDADDFVKTIARMPAKPALLFILGGPLIISDFRLEESMSVVLPYDIPYVSYRHAFSGQLSRFKKSFWMPDKVHMNWKGHELVAQLFIRWFQWVTCLGLDYEEGIEPLVYFAGDRDSQRTLLQLQTAADNDEGQFRALRFHDGWEFRAESDKYGWISETPNSTVKFYVPSETQYVTVGLLRSYENMGACYVTVLDGKDIIASATIDALWTIQASQYDETEIVLPPGRPREPRRIVRFENFMSPVSHSAKFKILLLAASQ